MSPVRSVRGVWQLTALLAPFLVLSCSTKDLQLETRTESTPSEANGGSSTVDETEDAERTQDSQMESVAAGGEGGDDDEWLGPSRRSLPCFAKDDCNECPGDRDCESCEDSQDCDYEFPVCAEDSGTCQECTDATHCLVQYGLSFPVCAQGSCVQCASDSDCSSGASCDNGWCGRCERDSDCGELQECRGRHCFYEVP